MSPADTTYITHTDTHTHSSVQILPLLAKSLSPPPFSVNYFSWLAVVCVCVCVCVHVCVCVYVCALPYVLSVKEAGNVGFKLKTSFDTIECQPTTQSETISAFDIHEGCTCLSQAWPRTKVPSGHPPISVCVCVCARAHSCTHRCMSTWNYWHSECGKQTPACNKISVLEEINMLALKEFVFNAMWRFRPECLMMGDSIDRGSEFSCCQHCLISLRVWHAQHRKSTSFLMPRAKTI